MSGTEQGAKHAPTVHVLATSVGTGEQCIGRRVRILVGKVQKRGKAEGKYQYGSERPARATSPLRSKRRSTRHPPQHHAAQRQVPLTWVPEHAPEDAA